MLNYYTLRKKPHIRLKSNVEGNTEVECLDLLARKNYNVNLFEFELCEVTEYYVGRPDLISYAFYGTDEYGDVICKVNGISNPFEMNIGDIIIVPSLYRTQEYVQDLISEAVSELADDEQVISPESYHRKKLNNESRSPNELTINKSNFVIDNTRNIVFY